MHSHRLFSSLSIRQFAPDLQTFGTRTAQTDDVAAPCRLSSRLLAYLGRRWGVADLRFAVPPRLMPDGWETYPYAFQLRKNSALSANLDRPLVLRVYATPAGLPRARHEFAVQSHLHARGYPVPEPLLLEEDCAAFGGPFLVMEAVEGPTLMRYLYGRPWRVIDQPARMAALQAALHALSAEQFPSRDGLFLDRRLAEMEAILEQYLADGLRPGLEWLRAHRPPPPATPHILHLDFHPLNLIRRTDGQLVVLDWSEADVGDLHADVATTLMLIQCVPAPVYGIHHRIARPIGRVLLCSNYLRAYSRLMPLDADTLAYYRGFAALRRLCNYSRWLAAGPRVTGSKSSSLRYLVPGHRAKLCRYFHRWTGVAVRL